MSWFYFLKIEIVLLAIVSLWFLLYVLSVRLKKWRIRQKQKRGVVKEAEAKKLLERKRYRVLEYQPEFWYTAIQGNTDVRVCLKPDYLVEKDGRLFCVEVKTGHGADGLSNKNTRRQILEYACFIKCSGVLFVDMEHNEIKRIRFPMNRTYAKDLFIVLLLLVIAVLLYLH